MTSTDATGTLPTWSVTDLHESFDARSFHDEMERMGSDVTRLHALFDEHDIRAIERRTPTQHDADTCATLIDAYNATAGRINTLTAYVYATVSTDTRNERAQALLSEAEVASARVRPLMVRFADWVEALGSEALAALHPTVGDHAGPLRTLAQRASHQMREDEEGLYAELQTVGSSAWSRLHGELTSQLTASVQLPSGTVTKPITAEGLLKVVEQVWTDRMTARQQALSA